MFRFVQFSVFLGLMLLTAGCSGGLEANDSDEMEQPNKPVETPRYSAFQLSGLLEEAGIPCEKEGPLFEASIESGAKVSRAVCTHSSLGEGVYSLAIVDDSSDLLGLIRRDICSQYLDSRPEKTFVRGENWYLIDFVQSVFLPEDFQVATKGNLVTVGEVCR